MTDNFRDKLRAATVRTPAPVGRSELIEFVEKDGRLVQASDADPEDGRITFEVRQPTVGDRDRILRAAGITLQNPAGDGLTQLQLAAVLTCVYVPRVGDDGLPTTGGTARVFDMTDRERLLAEQPGSYFDILAAKALALLNVSGAAAGKG